MRNPKVIFRGSALREIKRTDPSAYPNRAAVESTVTAAVTRAEPMAHAGLRRLERTLAPRRRRAKKAAWRADPDITRFFGERPLGIFSMRATTRRMRRVSRRLEKRRLRIRLLPQSRGSSNSTRGHNLGAFMSVLRFVLFPRWFTVGDPDQRAAIVIHELLHDRHIDHKVKVGGKKQTAYGRNLAQLLATQRPRRARRNPENFEQFCLAVT